MYLNDASTGTEHKMYRRGRMVAADTESIEAIEGLGMKYRGA